METTEYKKYRSQNWAEHCIRNGRLPTAKHYRGTDQGVALFHLKAAMLEIADIKRALRDDEELDRKALRQKTLLIQRVLLNLAQTHVDEIPNPEAYKATKKYRFKLPPKG